MKLGRNDRRRRGATLVLVTTIGVIVGILGLSMIQLGYDARILAVRDVEKVSARCAADAGLSQAYMRMQQKLIRESVWSGAISPGSGTLEATNAQYSYTVGLTSGYYEIISTGSCGMATKTVHGVLKVGSYWEGIGVDTTVNAKLGTYFGAVGPGADEGIQIRSNSRATNDMIFKAYVTVAGDVYSGPGSVPDDVIDVKATTIIKGQTDASAELMVWPPIAAPTNLTAGPDITAAGVTTLPQGRYSYASLSIPKRVPDVVVQIAPGTGPTVIYVAGEMRLGQGVEIQVLAGASLEIYVGTALISSEGTGFGNDNTNAGSLKIFGLPTCTEIDMKTKSNTFASVYAPDADITLFNSGDFYGAIVGDSFEMKNSGNFYFDTRLATANIDDILAKFIISRWWEE
jgi:Tfp pilus assembly protein PilX